MMCRFHTQTAGSSLTATSIDNNVVRTTVQALAAILGGTQSLHTNSRDEALALPTQESARLALRTQQILAYESGVTETPDPLAGSYFVESLTDQLEAAAQVYLDQIDAMGGAIAAIEAGFQQRNIQDAAYRAQRRIESGDSDRGRGQSLPGRRGHLAAHPAHRPGRGGRAGGTAAGLPGRAATRTPGRPPWTACPRPRPAPTTWCRRSSTPSRRAAPWGR